HAFPGRERLDGHEAVVFREGRETHGSATPQMIEKRVIVDSSEKPHAIPGAEMRCQSFERLALVALARDDGLDSSCRGLHERTQEEIESFERGEAGNGEDVVAVALAAVRARGRRRSVHVSLDSELLEEAPLNRLRLRDHGVDVSAQQPPIDGVNADLAAEL